MQTIARRRITLLDLVLLITATAIGLSALQLGWLRKGAFGAIFDWSNLNFTTSGYPSKQWLIPIAERVILLLPCLAAWTGAYLLMRLRAPRPRWRRLVTQPGFVAAVAVLATIALESIPLFGSLPIDGRLKWATPDGVATFAANSITLLAHHAGLAAAISWLTLLVIGRWRPERSWVDRFGRMLGCLWILIGPFASLLINHATWWGDFFN